MRSMYLGPQEQGRSKDLLYLPGDLLRMPYFHRLFFSGFKQQGPCLAFCTVYLLSFSVNNSPGFGSRCILTRLRSCIFFCTAPEPAPAPTYLLHAWVNWGSHKTRSSCFHTFCILSKYLLRSRCRLQMTLKGPAPAPWVILELT